MLQSIIYRPTKPTSQLQLVSVMEKEIGNQSMPGFYIDKRNKNNTTNYRQNDYDLLQR